MHRVDYSSGARRELESLARSAPANDVRAIQAAVGLLAEDPRPRGALKLKAPVDIYRLRVRSHRIVYVVDDAEQLVLITRVMRRSEGTYRDL